MSTHKYTSWGRTRRPKNIAGADGAALVNVSSLAAAKTITDAISADYKANPASGVYSTENQRYLHISSVAGAMDNLWVYYYATGKWSEFKVWDYHSNSKRTVTVGANETIVIDILGADLVAFKLSDDTHVYAACSTF